MAQEGKPPESGSTDAPADVAPPKDAGDAPPSSLSADAQKDQQVEDAKARVAAAKEAAQKAATPAAPKAPVKKKDEGPKPVDAGPPTGNPPHVLIVNADDVRSPAPGSD